MIGIFDSGVGGLTVVKEVFKYLPDYQIIYFGDTARLPYGTKEANFVQKYSAKIVRWLIKRGAKLVIIACHTSSAWASEFLKKEFKKIPIFEVITPGVKAALDSTGCHARATQRKIGIIGTAGTIRSKSYQKKLLAQDSNLKIYSKACPLFVPLVEEDWINCQETEEIAKVYLKPLKNKKIDTLILGCTHYPLLKNTIKKIMGPEVKIINPAESLVKDLKLFLENNPKIDSGLKRGDSHKFFFSDEPYNLRKISKFCLGREIKIKVKDPF